MHGDNPDVVADLRPIVVEARRRGLITGRELSATKELRGLRAVLGMMCLTGFALTPPFGWRMGWGVIGRWRHRRSGHWKFDGVQFLAHVGHDQPLIDPVDFLARVVDQLHHFGLRHALLGPARDEVDAGAMTGTAT